jgi:hypothetical protein
MVERETLREKSRIFNLSSATADIMYNGSMNSSGLWTIQNFVNHDENVQHIYFSVSHCEIPNSFYLINQYNNCLAITSGGISTIYIVPVGNYNTISLATAIKLLLPSTYTITYNSTKAKYTITALVAFTITTTSTTISRIMGLSKTADMVASLVGSTYTLELPFVVNFLPTARLNVRSAALQLDNYHSNDQSNDVFLSLQNNSAQNAMILYENTTLLKYHMNLDNLNMMDIRITDDSNRCLDFNNSAWFLTVRVDIQYYPLVKTTNFSNIIKDNNKLLLEYLQSMAEEPQ